MRRLSVTEVANLLQNETPDLLDVREPWEFDTCHIEGSKNIPMGEIPQHLEQLSDQKETIVICHHGVRSMQVITYLMQQGLDNFTNLDGGIDAWARQVDLNMAVY